MYTMGGIMLLLSFLRLFFFHLYESPKYLMGRGRDADAVEVVHEVAKYNGKTSRLTLQMLKNVEKTAEESGQGESKMDTSAKAAVARKLKILNWQHVKSLFATRKLAYSTTLLMIVWGMLLCFLC
jgi:hypothetical protein